jgi:hypothetical protein
VWETISHPYKISGKIIIFHILHIFTFLDSRQKILNWMIASILEI